MGKSARRHPEPGYHDVIGRGTPDSLASQTAVEIAANIGQPRLARPPDSPRYETSRASTSPTISGTGRALARRTPDSRRSKQLPHPSPTHKHCTVSRRASLLTLGLPTVDQLTRRGRDPTRRVARRWNLGVAHDRRHGRSGPDRIRSPQPLRAGGERRHAADRSHHTKLLLARNDGNRRHLAPRHCPRIPPHQPGNCPNLQRTGPRGRHQHRRTERSSLPASRPTPHTGQLTDIRPPVTELRHESTPE